MADNSQWLTTKQVVEEYGFYVDRWWRRAKAGVVVTKRVKAKGEEVLQGRNGEALRFSRASIEEYIQGQLEWLSINQVKERYGYSGVFWYLRGQAGEVVVRRGDCRNGHGRLRYKEASIIAFVARRRNGFCMVCGLPVKNMPNHLQSREHKHQEKGARQENHRLVLGGISYPGMALRMVKGNF